MLNIYYVSIAFILLIYAAIETIMTYATAQKKGTLIIAIGLGLLATGEFLGWYSVVFPKSVLYYISIMIQIFGLICIFIPIGRITLTRKQNSLLVICEVRVYPSCQNSFVFTKYTKLYQ